ncbi:BatA domain-containing protein [Odoribacter sp. OttesenSCG-928-L07]|nr:BatA domain-containing protein [Odoribacter sp. OttesenSCG-928-L07]
MKFYNPQYLWLLLALIIPIIIHFFRFRKFKTEYFTNVELLRKLNIEKRKISNLRRLIILCLRLLAITCLVFVFAKPYIPKTYQSDMSKTNIINIYIDNSASMEEQESISLLDNAKKKAKQIVMMYGTNNLYKIYSNTSPLNPPLLNKDDAFVAIDNIKISFTTKNLSSVVAAFNFESNQDENICYYISDFQITSTDFENLKVNNQNIFFIPVESKFANNLYIKDIIFTNPASIISNLHQIDVIIENKSDLGFEKVPVSLFIENKLVSSAIIDVAANSSITLPMAFPDEIAGIKSGYVHIEDNSVDFDNTFFFTYKLRDEIAILNIYDGEPNKYIMALFSSDSIFNFHISDRKYIKYDQLSSYDLVIIDGLSEIPDGLTEELYKNMELEKNIMLIPKNDFLDLESYNSFLNKFSYGKMNPLINTNDRNTSIAFESGFFDNVFYNIESLSDKNLELPITNLYFPIERNDEVIPIIKLSSNNSNIFSYKKISNAALYVFAMPFDKDYTDLQLNALFVPIMYKTSFSISGENSLSYYPNEKNIRLNSTIKSNDNLKLLCKTDSIFNAYVFENFNNNISLRFKDDDEAPASNYIVTQNNIAVDGFSINNSREESVF